MSPASRPHPVYGLPFPHRIVNELEAEYRTLTPWQKVSARRKILQRDTFAGVTGQWRRQVDRVPDRAGRILWVYGWGALGDSLMDLAVRRHLPGHLSVDLLISPALRPIYTGDPFWRDVHGRIEDCTAGYDFVLLQHLSTRSLALKIAVAPEAAFASVLGHIGGERFDRMAYAEHRLGQLFGWPAREPAAQHLPVRRSATRPPGRVRIAVALGARDPRRSYRQWARVLEIVSAFWPSSTARPLFVLMGDATANADLATFDPAFVVHHCRIEVDRLGLPEVVASMSCCDAFLGMDGGLMHVAVAVGTPGLAVFAQIDPSMRLRPQTPMRPLFTPVDVRDIRPEQIATSFLALLADRTRPAGSGRGGTARDVP